MVTRKLTFDQAEEIRRRIKAREDTQVSAALEFGISQSMVSKIMSDEIYNYTEEREMTVLERDIEKAFVARVAQLGGMAEKFTSPGRRSVPDRICSMPGGRIVFVEFKAPGKVPTPKQSADHDRRRALGFNVLVIDTMEMCNAFK
jgi:predicted XRE-type DNA-binding protein